MIKIQKQKSLFLSDDKSRKLLLRGYYYIFELYGIKISIIFGRKAMSKFNKFSNYDDTSAAQVFSWLPENNELILFFKDKPSTTDIVHESVHVCDRILAWVGCQHPQKSNEVNSYLTTHIVNVVLKAKKKHNKESKKRSKKTNN